MANSTSLNQTHFSQERPWQEDAGLPTAPESPPSVATEVQPVIWWRSRRGKMVIAGSVIGLVVVMLIMASVQKKLVPTLNVTTEPSPTTAPLTDAVTNRLDQLNRELDAAEPTKQQLNFPIVNLDIRLDEPKGRN